MKVRLGDVATIFDGPHATPARVDQGPYFLNIASLDNGRLDLEKSDHVSTDDFSRWTRRVTPRENDLLFSYETRLGEAALMPAGVQACLGRRMALLRFDTEQVVPKYFLYYYVSPVFRTLIETRTIHGATVNRIPLSTMGDWQIDLPPMDAQLAIADVLGALDDKIAANRKLAETADSWTREAFLQCTQQGSETVTLGDLVENVRVAVSPDELTPGEVYVGLEHIPRRLVWLSAWDSAAAVSSGKSRFLKGDILFGKLRPYFHKVVSAPIVGVCSTDVLVLRPRQVHVAGFALAAASSDRLVARATETSEGTRMPRAKWSDLRSAPVAWPGDSAVRQFNVKVAALRDAIDARTRENHTLANLRDTLLPRLISGELRVRDAERQVESVL